MGMMNKMMDAMVGSMKPDEKQKMMLKMMPEMIKEIKILDVRNLVKDKLVGKSSKNLKETIKDILKQKKR